MHSVDQRFAFPNVLYFSRFRIMESWFVSKFLPAYTGDELLEANCLETYIVMLWSPWCQCNALKCDAHMLIIIVHHISTRYMISRMPLQEDVLYCKRLWSMVVGTRCHAVQSKELQRESEMQWICFLFLSVLVPSQLDACSNWLRQLSIGHLLSVVSSKALFRCQPSLRLLLKLCWRQQRSSHSVFGCGGWWCGWCWRSRKDCARIDAILQAQMDRKKVGWMDGWKDKWVDGWVGACVYELTDELMNDWKGK